MLLKRSLFEQVQKAVLVREAGMAPDLLAIPEGDDGGDVHDAVFPGQLSLLVGVYLGDQGTLRDLVSDLVQNGACLLYTSPSPRD